MAATEGVGQVLEALRRTALFNDIEDGALLPLVSVARERRYGQKQLVAAVALQGEVVMLRSGALRLFRCGEDGTEITLTVLAEGDVIGIGSAADDVIGHSVLQAVADETRIVLLPRGRVRRILIDHPNLALRWADSLAAQLRDACDRVEELALQPVRSRLAHELAARSDGHRVTATHDELAAWIGTKQIEVTRGLRGLREEHLIESRHHRRGVTILEREKLATYKRSRS